MFSVMYRLYRYFNTCPLSWWIVQHSAYYRLLSRMETCYLRLLPLHLWSSIRFQQPCSVPAAERFWPQWWRMEWNPSAEANEVTPGLESCLYKETKHCKNGRYDVVTYGNVAKQLTTFHWCSNVYSASFCTVHTWTQASDQSQFNRIAKLSNCLFLKVPSK